MNSRLGYFLVFSMMMQWMFFPPIIAIAQPVSGLENSGNSYCEALVFESNQLDKARLEIYLQVPYNEISFAKDDREYIGRYEISTTLQDSAQQQIWQHDQSVELHAKDFSQTISSRLSSFKQFSVPVNSGTYLLQVQMIDQETKKSIAFKRRIVVNPFLHEPLALSNVMLVSRITKEGARTNIVPNLKGVVEHVGERIYFYTELYARVNIDSVAVLLSVLNEKSDTVVRQEKTVRLNGSVTQLIWDMPDTLLPMSKATLIFDARSFRRDSSGQAMHARTSRMLLVHLKDLPFTINDLDKAIEQLQYLAKGGEIDHIREASTVAEKEKRFLEFWQNHNPNASTPANSLMEEYYARVAYANKHFSHLGEGWKSDMGMVFILFGAPDNVERHPFNANDKPYEIWYYYTLGRQFIFIDNSGFGDYCLTYPTVDLWGRIY